MYRALLAGLLLLLLHSCGAAPKDRAIADTPAPAGVDRALWRELTRELERQLDLVGQTFLSANGTTQTGVSAPPSGATKSASALTQPAQLEYDQGSATLSWHVVHPGDYNLDGLVTVADLTPLGAHFGETALSTFGTPLFPHHSIHSAVDGDNNGEINIADVTPIAVNFGGRLEGYRIYRSADPLDNPADPQQPNGPGAQLVATLGLSAATQAFEERKQLSAQVVPTSITQRYWVRPFDGPDDGAASNSVEVFEGQVVNVPPVAKLKVTPIAGATPVKVTFDASTSSDTNDDSIVMYEWDLNDDGYFEYNSGAESLAPMHYYDPGIFTASVRVTDQGGLTSIAEASVTVVQDKKWEKQVIYSEQLPQAGYSLFADCLFLEVSDTPVFFLSRQANGFPWGGGGPALPPNNNYRDVLLCRPANLEATSWHEPELLHTNNGQDEIYWQMKAAAVLGGKPTLYFGHPSGPSGAETDLWALQGTSEDPQSWGLAEEIAGEPAFRNASASLVPLADGSLYREGNDNDLFIFSNDGLNITGSFQLNDPLEIKEIQRIGAWVGGVSSYSNQIFYRYSEHPNAESWPVFPTLVYESAMGVTDAHLGSVAGHPAIVFRNNSLRTLYYVRASDPEGTAWPAPTLVGIWSKPPVLLGLTEDQRPYILTRDSSSDVWGFVAANDTFGSSWGLVSTLPIAEIPNVESHEIGQLKHMPIFYGVRSVFPGPGIYAFEVEYWQYR